MSKLEETNTVYNGWRDFGELEGLQAGFGFNEISGSHARGVQGLFIFLGVVYLYIFITIY
jgi:hypothetical protein